MAHLEPGNQSPLLDIYSRFVAYRDGALLALKNRTADTRGILEIGTIRPPKIEADMKWPGAGIGDGKRAAPRT